MTIRESLNQKRRRLFYFALPLWALFAFAAATDRPWLVIPTFMGFMAAVIYQFYGFRCPLCGGNLGVALGHPGNVFTFGKKVRFCPFCSVDLDSEIKKLP
jgi:hypothetical protein